MSRPMFCIPIADHLEDRFLETVLCYPMLLTSKEIEFMDRVREILAEHLEQTVKGFDYDKEAITTTWTLVERAFRREEDHRAF